MSWTTSESMLTKDCDLAPSLNVKMAIRVCDLYEIAIRMQIEWLRIVTQLSIDINVACFGSEVWINVDRKKLFLSRSININKTQSVQLAHYIHLYSCRRFRWEMPYFDHIVADQLVFPSFCPFHANSTQFLGTNAHLVCVDFAFLLVDDARRVLYFFPFSCSERGWSHRQYG